MKNRKVREELVKLCSQQIAIRIARPLQNDKLDEVLVDLIDHLVSTKAKGDESAAIFDQLAYEIEHQPTSLWINGTPQPIDSGAVARAKHSLAFRAERYFRDYYRKNLEGKDLPGKLEYISERLESFSRIPLRFGQTYVMPALEYLYDDLEREFERQKKTMERRAILNEGHYATSSADEALPDNTPDDLPDQAMRLARICPLFRAATQVTQRKVWGMLEKFTRNQWALFFIGIDPKRKQFQSKSEALDRLVKPKAQVIEEISKKTNIRGIVIDERRKGYPTDQKKVDQVINLLKADALLRDSQ